MTDPKALGPQPTRKRRPFAWRQVVKRSPVAVNVNTTALRIEGLVVHAAAKRGHPVPAVPLLYLTPDEAKAVGAA